MKKLENIQRFYFFDYLFWIGEKLHKRYGRYVRRMGGDMVLELYLFAFVLFPLTLFLVHLFHDNAEVVLIISCVGIPTATTALNIIYSKRKIAVMKHYSRHRFNPVTAWILALFPFAVILVTLISQ